MLNNGQQHSIEKSRQLQRNLYLAAKKDKQRRFHALYDRIFRLDILWRAWKEVRENKGSAGIDGITFEMIEEYGVEEYLLDIQEDLKNKKYRPKPVKRVYIPKPDGKQRPHRCMQAFLLSKYRLLHGRIKFLHCSRPLLL